MRIGDVQRMDSEQIGRLWNRKVQLAKQQEAQAALDKTADNSIVLELADEEKRYGEAQDFMDEFWPIKQRCIILNSLNGRAKLWPKAHRRCQNVWRLRAVYPMEITCLPRMRESCRISIIDADGGLSGRSVTKNGGETKKAQKTF